MAKLFKFLTIFIFFSQSECFAQMASASLFSEMKSINPAVISGRVSGQYTLIATKDTIEKKQAPVAEENTLIETEVDGYSFFRGGKGGGFLTTEFSYVNSSGTKKSTHKATGLADTSISNDVEFSNLELALSLGKFFGLSFSRQSYYFESKFKFTFNSIDFEEDKKLDIDSNIIKGGFTLPMKYLRFAAYIETASRKEERDEFLILTGINKSSATKSSKTAGLALGVSTKTMHLEGGFEKSISTDDTTASPVRLSGTAEMKVWKFTLGYTARIYKDGFQDNDKMVYNQLAFPAENTESRTEHIINFAFGASKGFSIGGSMSSSESTIKEKNQFVSDSFPKVDTEVKQLGLMVKLGYVW